MKPFAGGTVTHCVKFNAAIFYTLLLIRSYFGLININWLAITRYNLKAKRLSKNHFSNLQASFAVEKLCTQVN